MWELLYYFNITVYLVDITYVDPEDYSFHPSETTLDNDTIDYEDGKKEKVETFETIIAYRQQVDLLLLRCMKCGNELNEKNVLKHQGSQYTVEMVCSKGCRTR